MKVRISIGLLVIAIKPTTEDKIYINNVYFTSLANIILKSFIFYEDLVSFGVVT